jgi:hypothetical protein
MFDRIRTFIAPMLLVMLAVLYAGSAASAQDALWRVSKASGDVSVTTLGGQQSALTAGTALNPGDNVRTGQNGRALLVRGEETILISPNSAIGIPAQKKSELTTTIIQQAGSILLEVEKRNVKHFQVETHYLAAVVMGTQFRVTVNNTDSRVDVLRGQVEVSDFKSGQFALVAPGQAAQVSQSTAGLSLSGAGTLSPIQQGTPRMAAIAPAAMPKEAAAPAPRAASAFGDAQPARTWASETQSKDSGLSFMSSWFSSSAASTGSRRSKQEDFALAAFISCAVGFVVAIVVGSHRRRKSRKLAKG